MADGNLVTLKHINISYHSSTRKKRLYNNAMPYMFLYLQFLKLDKLGANSLKLQSTTALVDFTVIGRTHQQRHE